MEESRNAYRVLMRIPDEIRPLLEPRRRFEDIIKMDLKEVGCDATYWMDVDQDRDQMADLCKSDTEPTRSLKVN